MLNKLFNKKYTTETFQKLLSSKPVNLKEIKRALDNSMDINTINENGDSFLHYCIKKGLTSSAKLLISEGIDISSTDSTDCTSLYLAIDKSNKTITKLLLAKPGININELNNNRTLLQEAVLQGDISIITMLLSTNIDKNHIDNRKRNVLFDAIANGNEKVIDTILSIKDLDLNIYDFENKTILHQDNILKDKELALKLISKGADPTLLDGDDKNYLLYTSLAGTIDDDIIEASINAGFNINKQLRDRNSILMEIMFAFSKLSDAEQERRDDLLAIASNLVDKGIDVNALNAKGETVLFNAVRKRDLRACAFLLKKKTPINVVNAKGETVLSECVVHGIQCLDIIFLLLRNGADISHVNKYKKSIIEILNELILYTHGNIDSIYIPDTLIDKDGQYMRLLKEILENTKYDVNHLCSTGEPLFFKSLLFGNRPLFTLYYNHGVNINTVNTQGNTIFARYVGKMASLDELPDDYRDVVIMLIDKKVDINKRDENGKTIFSQIITSNNMNAFRVLFALNKFDFFIQDNKGFTLIHDCIATSNETVIKLIDQIKPSLKNISDKIGLLPITYAALFGNLKLVMLFINLESNFTSAKKLSQPAKERFKPLLVNLDKLVSDDDNIQHKLDVLKEQIIKDFT